MGNSYSVLQQLSREEQEEYEYARLVKAVETAQAIQSSIPNDGQDSGPLPATPPIPEHLPAQPPPQQYNAHCTRPYVPIATQIALSAAYNTSHHASPQGIACESFVVSLVLKQY